MATSATVPADWPAWFAATFPTLPAVAWGEAPLYLRQRYASDALNGQKAGNT